MIVAVAGIDDAGSVQLGDPDPPGSRPRLQCFRASESRLKRYTRVARTARRIKKSCHYFEG